jgi:flagellar hook-associated protein 1 FlgK
LFENALQAQSDLSASQALSNGLNNMAAPLNLNDTSSPSQNAATDQSPATLIGQLSAALQQYDTSPDNASFANAVATAAATLAANLNQNSTTVQGVREQADRDISTAVSNINSLLAQFQTVNTAIVAGTASKTDVNDEMDTRDGILKQLSNEIGIKTISEPNNGVSIYTDSGVTLFNGTPRPVTFTPTGTYADGTVGQSVLIDGVPVTGASAVMPLQSGAIVGLTQLRDVTTVNYQDQLNQIANGLINTFAEPPPSGQTGPTLAGLFSTTSQGSALPSTTTGLAAAITLNPAVDPSKGGTTTNIRDGINYSYNTTGASAFGDQLQALTTSLAQTQSFNNTTGGIASGTLAQYAQSSVSWIEAQRQTATDNASYQSTVLSTATTALSNATGVNLDTEMSNMLSIEHAYQASSQLLNAVNTMYGALINVIS